MIWTDRPTVHGDEQLLACKFSSERTAEYDDLTDRAVAALQVPVTEQRRALRSLRVELRAIRRRDYFAAAGRQAAVHAVEAVAHAFTERYVAADLKTYRRFSRSRWLGGRHRAGQSPARPGGVRGSCPGTSSRIRKLRAAPGRCISCACIYQRPSPTFWTGPARLF